MSRDVITLTHVCQTWRQVFTSCSTLWTNSHCVDVEKTPGFWWLGWLVGTDNSQFFWSHSPSQASVCWGSSIPTNIHHYWKSPPWSSFSISWSAPHLCEVYIPSIAPTPGAPTPNPQADWLVSLRHLQELWIHGGEPYSLLLHHLLILIGMKLIMDIHTHNSRPESHSPEIQITSRTLTSGKFTLPLPNPS